MHQKRGPSPPVLSSMMAVALSCASPVPPSARAPGPPSDGEGATAPGPAPEVEARTPETPSLESTDEVEFAQLEGPIWLHTSWAVVQPWGRVSGNGLLIVGESEALMIDTPWNDVQTERVFEQVQQAFGVPITQVIVTHAHDDNLGGLGAAHRLGAVSYANVLTAELAATTGKVLPRVSFRRESTLEAAGTSVELFFPGPGHSTDNIVVYLPEWATLFGGCLIKGEEATSLGNTADADVPRWAGSVAAVAQRYPNSVVVVPGHGHPGDRALLTHTQALAEAAL